MSDAPDYLPIQSLDIEAEKKITFDLFLNLPLNQKVILYRRRGGKLENSRLTKLLEGDVQNFWIKREDYNEFVKYVAGRLKTLVDKGDGEVQRQMALSAAKAILTSTFASRDSAMAQALMGNLNQITGVLIEAVLEDVSPIRKKAFRKLVQLSEKGTDFHKHPVNVTSLSVLIAFGIGYTTDRILTEVAMGALLHDIGLSKLSAKVSAAAHDPMSLSIEERRELYKHGEMGVEILDERKIPVSEIMRAIVTQHHEEYNGSGYPGNRRGFALNEFAQVVRVADDLDHLIREQIEHAESLRRQMDQMFGRYQADKVIEPGLAARIRGLFLSV